MRYLLFTAERAQEGVNQTLVDIWHPTLSNEMGRRTASDGDAHQPSPYVGATAVVQYEVLGIKTMTVRMTVDEHLLLRVVVDRNVNTKNANRQTSTRRSLFDMSRKVKTRNDDVHDHSFVRCGCWLFLLGCKRLRLWPPSSALLSNINIITGTRTRTTSRRQPEVSYVC